MNLVPVEKKSLNIFVTGATGFVGQALVKRLVHEGHKVKALVRSDEGAALVKDLGAGPVFGSLGNILEWAPQLQGQDAVIHTAAPVDFGRPRQVFFNEVVQATLLLAEASSSRGVRRFIYLSSESAIYDHKPLVDVDESYPYPNPPNSFYGEAKMMAEQGLLSTKLPMQIIILRPPFVWGPGTPAFKQIAKKAKQGMFVWMDGGRNFFDVIHVDNLVHAIVLALTKGRDKQIYFVTDGQTYSAREFFTRLFRVLGVPQPKISVPSSVMYAVASGAERAWRLIPIGKRPAFFRIEIDFVSLPRRFKIDKARAELGYAPVVRFEEGFHQLEAHGRDSH
ncbi:MAG TPA: NAD-dependent epimerase/dehydratase family protein [Bdellovibrionales bacterium]|nr:NAD-dependent epimerase/dehydratase family protein [Bdellovibrionales bacterium]